MSVKDIAKLGRLLLQFLQQFPVAYKTIKTPRKIQACIASGSWIFRAFVGEIIRRLNVS